MMSQGPPKVGECAWKHSEIILYPWTHLKPLKFLQYEVMVTAAIRGRILLTSPSQYIDQLKFHQSLEPSELTIKASFLHQ